MIRHFRQPVLASVLKHRWVCIAVTGAALVQVAASLLGYTIWACPLLSSFDVPCPGCGLTRSLNEMLHFRWYGMLHLHAFSPLIFAALFLMTISVILSNRWRELLVHRIETVERKTGLTMMLLWSLLLYWVIRLAWPSAIG